MDNETISEKVIGGKYRVRVVWDEDSESPREWSNLGRMACRIARYDLGDADAVEVLDKFLAAGDDVGEERTLGQWLRDEYGATVVLPLFLYDHSGLSIKAGGNLLAGENMSERGRFIGDAVGWDTSTVGVIFDTPETRSECGTPLELTEQALRDEVEEYDAWLTGQVFAYVVERKELWTNERGDNTREEWEFVEACGGFYADDEALGEGITVAKGLIASEGMVDNDGQ